MNTAIRPKGAVLHADFREPLVALNTAIRPKGAVLHADFREPLVALNTAIRPKGTRFWPYEFIPYGDKL